ncbi:MAG TPA: EAL domain-containing protein, partial [Burkholderiales bacterium]
GAKPIEVPPGEIALPGGDYVWVWTDPRSAVRYLVFIRGTQWAAIEGAEFVDVLLGSPDRSLAVLGSRGEFAVAELNQPRLDEMRAVLAGRRLARDDEWFYAAARSGRYPLAAVAGEPRERVIAAWRTEARTLIPAGLMVAALLAFGVYRLARRQFALPAEIAAGLRNGEFFAEYQPLVELATGRCIGAEALVRWRRWDGTTLAPDLFVPAAEECGLIGPITDHMVRCVVRDLGQFLAGRRDVHIAVNLAAPDLLRERIAEVVAGAISGTGIEPAQIWLEATERGFVDSGPAREVIHRLRALGHTLCIDDFGTGYSNLSYLQTLEVDALKIDKMFVEAIGTGAATSTVIDHMISMAGTLGLAIVAEGVTTGEQAEYLRVRGVQYGQGYLFSKSLPAAEFIRFVEGRGGGAAVPAR